MIIKNKRFDYLNIKAKYKNVNIIFKNCEFYHCEIHKNGLIFENCVIGDYCVITNSDYEIPVKIKAL